MCSIRTASSDKLDRISVLCCCRPCAPIDVRFVRQALFGDAGGLKFDGDLCKRNWAHNMVKIESAARGKVCQGQDRAMMKWAKHCPKRTPNFEHGIENHTNVPADCRSPTPTPSRKAPRLPKANHEFETCPEHSWNGSKRHTDSCNCMRTDTHPTPHKGEDWHRRTVLRAKWVQNPPEKASKTQRTRARHASAPSKTCIEQHDVH